MQNNNPEQIAAICHQIPINRLGTPEEVADLVFYLGSEQNTYITGQTLIVDGGFMSR
jgi:3-oxoacyl-[acyl-carrier protein] reductase